MEFTGPETIIVEILRTPELQRMRRVRQLGMAYQVFPAAEHSRFTHSLGAAHLAIRFGRHLRNFSRPVLSEFLRIDDSAIRDLAIAALCHDVGHGPLSHAWEREVIGDHFDREAWMDTLGIDMSDRPPLANAKWHEIITDAILGWTDGALHRLLEQHEPGSTKRIRNLLRGSHYLTYLPKLLSADVDVDRADFLLRDAHTCGVGYGTYDFNWLISTSRIGFTDRDDLVLGFDERKSPSVIEQVILARASLYETLYFHKTVRSAEMMVGLLLRRLRVVDREPLVKEAAGTFMPYIKALSGNPLTVDELLKLDDFGLFQFIEAVAECRGLDPTARDLAQRVISRNFFKLVAQGERVTARLQDHRFYERMIGAVKPYAPAAPDFYVNSDLAVISLLNEAEAEKSYFVGDDDRASPISSHPRFNKYVTDRRELHRVFTIEEAVQDVRKEFA